ncbi:pyridoxal-phosphate dependent enzyme [Gelidibacter salicanalis]|uniref:Pyridoxal-phosphate dependent enzyme n=1 Tax=Gelidibacter salicanalis TaxID=291193 RepID=A0A934KVN4_9FLAO|nr:pyridoxal-phosphate dependent enzyme [Gelidibacter salicanalis]MBJ7882845.1 pyridoxal-phosphate dependent enzyme [Gelidibacter salicanalis]
MDKQMLRDTSRRISPYIHNTPIFTSHLLDDMTGAKLFFKCENFQKMGAFKMRGAVNAVLQLTKEERERGVVTHSSGNFAQALSLAAKNLDVPAYIVMPNNAPKVKKDAVVGYGGIITACEPNINAREEAAAKIVAKKGATFVHPSNDLNVILGNATVGMELLNAHPNLDMIVAPVGGGGLIAGTALSSHVFGKNCKVIGGEPLVADDAYRSLESGQIETNYSTNTVADGLRTQLGDINFPIIQQYVDHIIRVEEVEIIQAMKLLWERLKIVIEPSSAVAFAAVLKNKDYFKDKRVGIILSGGNVDLETIRFS